MSRAERRNLPEQALVITCNRQVRLARRPVGIAQAADSVLTEGAVPEPGPDEIRLRVDIVSRREVALRGLGALSPSAGASGPRH
jgi:hypothetical protein